MTIKMITKISYAVNANHDTNQKDTKNNMERGTVLCPYFVPGGMRENGIAVPEKCPVLREYMWLINFIRDKALVNGIEMAVKQAVKGIPEGFSIRDFCENEKSKHDI